MNEGMRAGYPLKSSVVVLFSIIVANSSPVALPTHASIALPPAGYRFYPSCKQHPMPLLKKVIDRHANKSQ